MDFKQLESFVMIAKLKSFSKAADKLYLTQPTISNHIHNLEKELGTALFNRTNKNITLTSAGDILYKYALSIINKRDHAYFSLNQYKGRIEGTLEIASSTIPEQYFLAEKLAAFSQKYPDVRYSLMKYDTKQVIEKLQAGEIDFGIVGAKKDMNQLEYIEILDDDIVLVAPNTASYQNMDYLSMDNFLPSPLIYREEGSGTRTIIETALRDAGVNVDDLNIIAVVESTETIKKLVSAGLGLSFISKRAIDKDIQAGTLKILPLELFNISRKFYFVYHKKRVLSPLSETFKAYLLDKEGLDA